MITITGTVAEKITKNADISVGEVNDTPQWSYSGWVKECPLGGYVFCLPMFGGGGVEDVKTYPSNFRPHPPKFHRWSVVSA